MNSASLSSSSACHERAKRVEWWAHPDSNGGPTDYESAAHSAERIVNKGDSERKENVLASCLASLTPKMPDLAIVVDAWPKLPEAIRAGILAMVKAASGGRSE